MSLDFRQSILSTFPVQCAESVDTSTRKLVHGCLGKDLLVPLATARHTNDSTYYNSLITKQKPSRRCPGCSLEGEVKFEYSFKLNLVDELDQTFTVDVDDEHAVCHYCMCLL